jgi:sulfatase maturation enzyme AslB (radical SAM superfamily)
MTLGEVSRNLVELGRYHRLFDRAYDAIGRIPAYRRMIIRRARRRIDYVQRERNYGLMIELSTVCNARCVFCPHPTMEREKRIMDEDLFELIVKRVLEEKIKPTVIDLFHEGEPLADRRLPERIKRLKALFPSSKVRIYSNFALASPEKIDELLDSGLDTILISLNAATKESHREIMGLDFEKTVRNVEMLLEKRKAKKSSLHVTLSFVICEQNRSEVNEFSRTWKRKVNRINFQRAIDWGGALPVKGAYLDSHYPCMDLFERIVFLSNGDFGFCCTDPSGIVGTNVRDTPILSAFNSKIFEEMRKVHLEGDISQLQMCRNCFGVHTFGTNWLLAEVPRSKFIEKATK